MSSRRHTRPYLIVGRTIDTRCCQTVVTSLKPEIPRTVSADSTAGIAGRIVPTEGIVTGRVRLREGRAATRKAAPARVSERRDTKRPSASGDAWSPGQRLHKGLSCRHIGGLGHREGA